MNGAVCSVEIAGRSTPDFSAPEWKFLPATGPHYSSSVSEEGRILLFCRDSFSPTSALQFLATVPRAIMEEIARAQEILSLPDDWDGDGSPAYRPEVLKRATDFLEQHAKWLLTSHGAKLDTPHIGPGPSGSIDVHWKTGTYELLVNVPAGAQAPASFYGDDYQDLQIKGTFHPSRINAGFLQLWLSGER